MNGHAPSWKTTHAEVTGNLGHTAGAWKAVHDMWSSDAK
jgi:hypothetical protein